MQDMESGAGRGGDGSRRVRELDFDILAHATRSSSAQEDAGTA
jgi:hypothetical protein